MHITQTHKSKNTKTLTHSYTGTHTHTEMMELKGEPRKGSRPQLAKEHARARGADVREPQLRTRPLGHVDAPLDAQYGEHRGQSPRYVGSYFRRTRGSPAYHGALPNESDLIPTSAGAEPGWQGALPVRRGTSAPPAQPRQSGTGPAPVVLHHKRVSDASPHMSDQAETLSGTDLYQGYKRAPDARINHERPESSLGGPEQRKSRAPDARIPQHLEANGKAPVNLSDPYMRVETGGAGGHGRLDDGGGARSQNWVPNEYSELTSGGGVTGINHERPASSLGGPEQPKSRGQRKRSSIPGLSMVLSDLPQDGKWKVLGKLTKDTTYAYKASGDKEYLVMVNEGDEKVGRTSRVCPCSLGRMSG